MDRVAISNRCLWDVRQLAHNEWRQVGDVARGRQVRVPFKESIDGYQWLAQQLRPMELSRPSDADFDGYATRWEKRYSVLSSDQTGSLEVAPVVDYKPFFTSIKLPASVGGFALSMYPVVAHYGSVYVGEIIVLRKFATESTGTDRVKALNWILNNDIAYVEQGYPAAGDWGPFAQSHNLGPNYFTVLTDPEGRILANLGSFGAEPGLVSEDPISYLMVVPGTLRLAALGGKIVLRLVSQRVARKAAVNLIFVEIGAGDLKAAINYARKGGVRMYAVDPVKPAEAAIRELEGLGGQYVQGTADAIQNLAGNVDHVYQYFPWHIDGAGRFIGGGTYRVVDDAARLLKPGGAAHFVTEDEVTAKFLVGEGSRRGYRGALTKITRDELQLVAPGASAAGVVSMDKLFMVNIYK